MGGLPSKHAAHNPTEPEKHSRKVTAVSTQSPRSSSAEHLTAPLTPASIVSETPITQIDVAPLPKRLDCIAPRPQSSDDSLRRHDADYPHDSGHERGHGEIAAAGLAGGATAGVAAFGGDDRSVGYDVGTDVGEEGVINLS
ncbi:hypothetical protein BDV93DRAFT_232151 [Ceratobasidium sp. AG-I]|nr:hypothetical protein BDV93DRAFT_232151 [Ceratobasidium sp. AG-I]